MSLGVFTRLTPRLSCRPEALEILNALQGFLEPPQCLSRCRKDGEGHNLHVENLLVELVQQFDAATFVFPSPEVNGAHTKGTTGHISGEGSGHVFANVVIGAGMGPMQQPSVRGVRHFKGSHNGSCRERLNLKPSSRHLLHPFSKVLQIGK